MSCCNMDIQVVLGRPRFLFDGFSASSVLFWLGLLDLVPLYDKSRNGGVFLLSYSMVLLLLVCIVWHLRLHVGTLCRYHTLVDDGEMHQCFSQCP